RGQRPQGTDRYGAIWEIEKLIRDFLNWPPHPAFLRPGNGTSLISLIVSHLQVAKMLADEFGTPSIIKSRVNPLSVLGIITSVQQRLKLYNKGPPSSFSTTFR
uniref:Eukaryotic peptide chain release factor subunit 1 n=1 Tax=Sciurus vulgaris TaxID=55149 RepID=A0A8D2AY91_SCIVU